MTEKISFQYRVGDVWCYSECLAKDWPRISKELTLAGYPYLMVTGVCAP